METLRACVFDAYGTLFDVHAAIRHHAGRVGPAADAISTLWRAKQIEATWLRSLMHRHADFWQLTQDALDYALALHGIQDSGLRADLLRSYRALDAFPDAAATLQRLREAGLRTAILSNGTPDMLRDAAESAGIGGLLDGLLSVEQVGIYKPDSRVYQLAIDWAGVASPREICFVSSNGWDAAGAATFGFRVAWINRSGLPPERLPDAPEWELRSLSELVDCVKP